MVTQSLLLCLALLGVMDLPQPDLRFKVPIEPNHALSLDDGRMVFIHGRNLSVYDDQGQPDGSFELPLAPPPDLAFAGPGNSIWFHDGRETLYCLNQGFEVVRQRRLEPPSAAPQTWGEFLVYVVDRRVLLLDARSEGTRHSLERSIPISGVRPAADGVMIAEANGDVLRWNPVTAAKSWVLKDRLSKIDGFSVGPLGAIAAVNQTGELEVIGPAGKPSWRRTFGIDIPVDPVWLCHGDKARVVIATKGRNVLVYGWRGKEHARRLTRSWPRALLGLTNQVCLMITNHGDQLFWFHLEEGFRVEKTEHYQALVHASSRYILLVDAVGNVRRYLRQPIAHRADDSAETGLK